MNASTPLKILGIAGSLRKQSFNRATLTAASGLLPPNVTLDTFELDELPIYNQDLEASAYPDSAKRLKEAIRAADALLFVTPEYNYSIPGVLKNAIDWASRPYGDNAWAGKCAAIMGASIGSLGTARAQYHLRQIFVFLDIHALNQPEIMIGGAADKFDEAGHLTDDKTRELMRKQLQALADFTRARQPSR